MPSGSTTTDPKFDVKERMPPSKASSASKISHIKKVEKSPEIIELDAAKKVLGLRDKDPHVIVLSNGNPARKPSKKVLNKVAEINKKSLEDTSGTYPQTHLDDNAMIASAHYFNNLNINFANFLLHPLTARLSSLREEGTGEEFGEEVKASETKEKFITDNRYRLAQLLHDPELKGQKLLDDTAKAKKSELNGLLTQLGVITTEYGVRGAYLQTLKSLAGRNILIPMGFYHSFAPTPQECGKTYEVIDTSQNPNFRLSAAALEKWFSDNPDKTNDVCCLVIIDPGNPTGAVLTPQEKEAIAEFCREKKILVLEDTIYAGLEKEGIKFTPMASHYPEGTITISGLGKTYCHPQVRLSMILGQPEHISAITHTDYPNTATLGHFSATLELLDDDYKKENRAFYAKMFEFTGKKVAEINAKLKDQFKTDKDIIEPNNPEGAFFQLLQFLPLKGKLYKTKDGKIRQIKNCLDLSEFFTMEAGVKFAPTNSTGIPAELMFLRMSVGAIEWLEWEEKEKSKQQGDSKEKSLQKETPLPNNEEILKVAFQRVETAIANMLAKQEELVKEQEELVRAKNAKTFEEKVRSVSPQKTLSAAASAPTTIGLNTTRVVDSQAPTPVATLAERGRCHSAPSLFTRRLNPSGGSPNLGPTRPLAARNDSIATGIMPT